ncbi:C6 transcription factor [Aspergillus steynii IBT 23096]|uniref:C6 transcription factor n=1 Tax=Aspergillus steynii IBT 23096 TaxID=1392250 RepID=A0A2I2G6R5_9EURO|nr:C6 transcription factor [Aspergillus steynii IBT 23096]PLB48563.1 C6 transcription factor [Aspergillus steynii IBT 23096]
MDEGSDPKAPRRKRVSRACDRCRSKKDKCDGLRPACSACQASGQTCSYDPHAKKRGLPEGYVRGLEKLWALSICNIDGFEDTMLALLGSTAESAGRRDHLMNLWSKDGASETMHESWKTSRLYGALENLLSNSDASPSRGSEKRPREEIDDFSNGEGTAWGFRLERSSASFSPSAPRVVEPSKTSPRAKRARLSVSSDSRPISLDPGSKGSLQLPPQTSQLLDDYFAVTHSWFPILAKHNILRASYLYVNGPLPLTNTTPGSGNHAALWAILSYAISQSQTDTRDGSLEKLDRTKEYYATSRSLIPSETAQYEIGHVQALLLLTMVNIGLEDWTAAWLLSGQAARMAISMGLGALADVRRSDDLRQGKAVFLGCFVIDSLLSFRISRRPCMHTRDLASVGLLEEDGLEEWNSWADVLPPTSGKQGTNSPRRGPLLALSCFNRLVELASVLNKIARDTATGANAHMFAQQLVLELKAWDDRLPLGCRLIGPESIYPERHSALLPHQTYLGLTYVATLLWLYLRIAPHELGLHRSQRPAVEGAKKILYRALPMLSQHMENFQMCGLPPVFEFAIWTMAEQAFTLRDRIESDIFPFGRWAEALLQRTRELSPAWPVYRALTTTIEYWYHSRSPPETASPSFHIPSSESPALGGRSFSSHNTFADSISAAAAHHRNPTGEASMSSRNLLATSEPDYTSSILGIPIPVDTQYMTPKDTVMDNTDLSMLDVSFQEQLQQQPPRPADRTPTRMEKPDAANDLDALLPPVHPHPPTPDSSVSNLKMPVNTSSNDAPRSSGNNLELGPESSDMQGHSVSSSDIDSIFKDLAYLDTTEWATSREAGLKDFGFIDDSTFHAFCHDPDRLAGSEPLVHPPSIADIWPPPGFFPETFQDSSEDTMEG